MRKPQAISCKQAFTLVEMLMVMAIMIFLAALSVPAINSLGNSNRLDSGGRLLSNLVTIARSEAINQRTLVQLRVVTTNLGGTDDLTCHYRKMSLWKLDQTQTPPVYVQFSAWETLPEGVLVEPSTAPTTNATPVYNFASAPGTYFLNSSVLSNSNTTGGTTGGITIGSGTYNYAWVEFSPNGGTAFPAGYATVYLLLTEGFVPSQTASPVYTPKNHPNWFQVSVNSLTGMSNVVRP